MMMMVMMARTDVTMEMKKIVTLLSALLSQIDGAPCIGVSIRFAAFAIADMANSAEAGQSICLGQ